MSDAVYIALIAAIIVPIMGTIVTVLGMITKYIQDRTIANAQAERDRDAAALAISVAEKVEKTRQDLIAQNTNVDKKLDVIHGEVNHQLTKALEKVVELQSDIVTLKGIIVSRMQGPEAKAVIAESSVQSKVEEITEQAAGITAQAASVTKQAADVTAQAADIAKGSAAT